MKSGLFVSRPAIGAVVGVVALALSVGLYAPQAAAQAVDFSGKRITVIVGFREGGGADTYARLLAPFMSRHLPGQPTIVVQNIPGAGGVPGANRFQQEAKPDGLTVLSISTSNVVNAVLGVKTVRYKLHTYHPVILSPSNDYTYGSPSLGVMGPADFPKLVGKEIIFAGNNPTSAELRQLFMFHMLGMKVKPVWGLNSSKAALAFIRGETNVHHANTFTYFGKVLPLVKQGKVVPWWNLGIQDENGNFVRDPNTPDIPMFPEVYKQVRGEELAGPALAAWETIFHFVVSASKAWLLPADTPPEIVETYRDAARAMLKDPEFQSKRKKLLGIYRQVVGPEAKRILEKASTLTPEARGFIEKFLREEYNVKL